MNNRKDAFSGLHPAVNFAFFVGVILLGVTIQHPVYLVSGIAGAAVYYLLLKGRKGVGFLLGLLPMLLLLTLINPLFNTRGERVLFYLFHRPYTFEALLYGAVLAGILAVMFLWFGCYNAVMTGDKFTSLFGSLIPSLSLLLVMVLRMVPNLMKKASQIASARKSIGKGADGQASLREKLADGMTILSALVSWALEGGIVTGDSMRSRGYGSTRRTSFMLYRMRGLDWLMLAVILLLTAGVAAAAFLGGTAAQIMPVFSIAPIRGAGAWGLAAYCVLLLLPTLLHIKEAVQWYISRLKI